MKRATNNDMEAYYELSELIVKREQITSLMLSDIDSNRVLN